MINKILLSNSNLYSHNSSHGKSGLASIDIDGTLVPWTKHDKDFDEAIFSKNKEEMNKNKSNYYYLLNSSRGKIQFRSLAAIIKDVPYDAVSLNDGQEIYHLKNLLGFKVLLRDNKWHSHLMKTYNWDKYTPHKLIKKTLNELNFHEVNNREKFHFTKNKYTQVFTQSNKSNYCKLQKEQNHFLLKTNNPEIFESFQTKLKSNFSDKNIKLELTHYNKNGHYFIHLSPIGINKSSPIDFIINNKNLKSSINHVVTVGDGINDLFMLEKTIYSNNIPNMPIVINNTEVAEKVKNKFGMTPQIFSYINLSLALKAFNK